MAMTKGDYTPLETGYVFCACPECFEITINAMGFNPAFCQACTESDCDPEHDHSCQADHCGACLAYVDHADDCEDCEHNATQ